MSEPARNRLIVLLLLLLASSAFIAGYVVNDYLEGPAARRPALAEDDLGIFWEAWSKVEASFLGELPDSQSVAYGAIRGSLELLDDPYTVFVEPVQRDRERERLDGKFGGVGITLSRPEPGGDVLLEPSPGNPAEVAGVLSGDVLLAVDGQPITTDMSVVEIADLIKGETGTNVVLRVLHPGVSEPVDIVVERTVILLPSVSQRMLGDGATGYIQLSRFSAESAKEIEEAIGELQSMGAERYILDLRQNAGGLRNAAVEVADHFLNGGVVLYQQSKDEGERAYTASGKTLMGEAPLAILVDSGTASAAEILAGAFQDRGRAVLIGSSETFGKGSVQIVYELSDGSSVHVTSARWLTPNHTQIDQTGLTPDVIVEVTQADIDDGRDVVLERAAEILGQGG